MRRSRRLWCVLFAILSTFGCAESSGERRDSDPELRIGLSVDSLVVERWIRDTNAFLSAGEELGAEVLYRNALEDSERQQRDLMGLEQEGVDALVVIPFDSVDLATTIRNIQADGTPVIAYDRLILNDPIAAYVSFDNVEVGRVLAEGVTSRLDRARVVIMNGGKRDFNSAMLREGMAEVLEPYIKSGAYEIVAEISPEDWLPALFVPELEQLVENGVPIDAIIAANDNFADAAIDVLARHRLAGQVLVVGQDADLLATQRLVSGLQHRTIYKPVEKLARRAAQIAVELAQGKDISYSQTINNGLGEIPYVAIQPIAVERNNIDSTVIADGFHSRKDVYLEHR